MIASKIYNSIESLLSEIEILRHLPQSIVFTNGVFDLFHAGHALYLESAKAQGDFLIVGLNSDASVKRIKGPLRPIINYENRAIMLASLASVDAIICFEEDTPLRLIQQIKPDYLIKGGDYKVTEIVGYEELTSYGGKVMTIPISTLVSSTQIIQKIQELGSSSLK
ncbi:MAG TPA: D-glycero-beta-D-manno-heptose 1-phosphate adenylyltransferase [Saprospiraceae bacterium]|nr:D-glycero-beta-D-manno-heptose 1-phosphate adenylyltransferase [Saprospiraceae bacterium]